MGFYTKWFPPHEFTYHLHYRWARLLQTETLLLQFTSFFPPTLAEHSFCHPIVSNFRVQCCGAELLWLQPNLANFGALPSPTTLYKAFEADDTFFLYPTVGAEEISKSRSQSKQEPA